MSDIIFATLNDSARHIQLLQNSLCAFGGELADNPLYVIHEALEPVSADVAAHIHYEIAPEIARFPFARKVFAAAALETHFAQQDVTLVWLDSDTLILQEPLAFCLADQLDFAYSAVHHRLIGSLINEPASPFWQAIYDACGVAPDHVFSMFTVVDHAEIRSYFNAGHYALSSRIGLLTTWKDRFLELFDTPEMRSWYEKHALYQIFFHQAVFTGVMLAGLEPERMKPLPGNYNYPLHLYDDDASEIRPGSTDDLVTCRYESLLFEENSRDLPVLGMRLREWLR